MAPSLPLDRCKSCTRPASLRCSKCSEGVDTTGRISPTAYCSRECQKNDYKVHKVLCAHAVARKQLFRGSAFCQEANYALRESAWDITINDIKIQADGKLHVYLAHDDPDHPPPPFVPFPNHLVPNINDKKALLSHLGGRRAAANMHRTIEAMLEDCCNGTTDITTIGCYVGEDKPRIVLHSSEGVDTDRYGYESVVVKLKDGNKYIINLAGAQYGAMAPVELLETHARNNQLIMLLTKPFGHYLFWQEALLAHINSASYTAPHDEEVRARDMEAMIEHSLRKTIDLPREDWLEQSGQSFATVLSQKVDVYEAAKKQILEHIVGSAGSVAGRTSASSARVRSRGDDASAATTTGEGAGSSNA